MIARLILIIALLAATAASAQMILFSGGNVSSGTIAPPTGCASVCLVLKII